MCLARALKAIEAWRLLIHHLSYDIWCQFGVKLIQRFTTYFPDLVPVVEKLIGAIPKLHLVNHKTDCQYCFSYNYQKGVGRTDGEAIERFWAEANLYAASTKQQNGGHRHDTLDDMMGDHNWRKIVAMGK